MLGQHVMACAWLNKLSCMETGPSASQVRVPSCTAGFCLGSRWGVSPCVQVLKPIQHYYQIFSGLLELLVEKSFCK